MLSGLNLVLFAFPLLLPSLHLQWVTVDQYFSGLIFYGFELLEGFVVPPLSFVVLLRFCLQVVCCGGFTGCPFMTLFLLLVPSFSYPFIVWGSCFKCGYLLVVLMRWFGPLLVLLVVCG